MAMSLCPAHIHSHEHLRPVLALGTTGTGVDLQHAVHGGFLLTQHVLQLEVFDELQGMLVVGIDFFFSDHFIVIEVEG